MKKVHTNSKKFREIAQQHILAHKSPQAYGIAPTATQTLIERLAKEVNIKPKYIGEVAQRQVEGGSFLVYYSDIMQMMVEDLHFDADKLAARFDKADGQQYVWNFYIQFIKKGMESLYHQEAF